MSIKIHSICKKCERYSPEAVFPITEGCEGMPLKNSPNFKARLPYLVKTLDMLEPPSDCPYGLDHLMGNEE
jgi:hypothetical protein